MASTNSKAGALATETFQTEEEKCDIEELRDELDRFFFAQLRIKGETSQSRSSRSSSVSGSETKSVGFHRLAVINEDSYTVIDSDTEGQQPGIGDKMPKLNQDAIPSQKEKFKSYFRL